MRRIRRLGRLLIAGFLVAAVPRSQEEGAEKILAESGVRGGLVVQLGLEGGILPENFRAGDAFVVHALDASAERVKAAREKILSKGVYGPVSVEVHSGTSLPYADNLVNLIVSADPGDVSLKEILRVLVPRGVFVLRKGDRWERTVKPVPPEMDEWTHFLHGPDNNAVAHDQLVGPPRHVRWMGAPKFSRAHEQQASFSSLVTAAGRMFYVLDDAPRVDIRMEPRWMLVARDASNGIILWKRPMGKWVSHLRRFRSGPASLQFRMVAGKDRIFVTLDFEGPVSILDAATGKTLRVIEGSERTKQILHRNGALTLLIDEQVGKLEEIDQARRRGEFIPHTCRILRVDAATGKVLWRREIKELVFPCLCLRKGSLYGQTPARVFSLDAETGEARWSAGFKVKLPIQGGKARSGELQWEAPALLAGEKAVYAADFKEVHAYSMDDGKLLWSGPSAKGYNAPPDLFLIDGVLWMSRKGKRMGLDPLTGEPVREIAQKRGYMHPRCYRNKATDRFFMLGDPGVQLIELKSGEIWDNHWIRGVCQYGVMPANGLLYVPPDSCACNMKTKLNGLFALAAGRSTPAPPRNPAPVLEKGPAYGKVAATPADPGDWPIFRGAPGRNGLTSSKVPAELAPAWTAKVGGKLSSVTVSGGRVFVAAVDRYTLHALSAADGRELWHVTAGGRIDSPPTVHEGIVTFGSADGWVTAVRAEDGERVWRFLAAPENRRIMVRGRLESAWPVHGSVLLHKGVLAFAAGRSSYLDGGIHLVRLDPKTGTLLSRTVIGSADAEGRQPVPKDKDVRGALSDILLGDGDDVYMRHVKLDFVSGMETGTGIHLYSPLGFLDDTWWHRSYWLVGDHFQSHWSGWWKVGNRIPSGRILSTSDTAIFGFGRSKYPGGNTGQARGGETYQLFAHDRDKEAEARETLKTDRRGRKVKGRAKPPPIKYRWATEVPLLATALVVAGETVFIAGPPDLLKSKGATSIQALQLENPEGALDAWRGRKGGILWAASAADGSKLARRELASPPVFDGMAAANGKLYIALQNGEVVCLAQAD